VLARPLGASEFVAQVRAAARARASAARVAARANEARLLGGQLQKAYAQLDRELAAARAVRLAFLPRTLPAVGAARFAVCHRPRGRSGGDFYGVRPLDAERAGFFLGDVIGSGAAGGLLGVFAAQSAAPDAATSPSEVLAAVNRELLGLGLDDRPLVAMLAGTLNGRTGKLAIARAGLPGPVFVPAGGEPEAWSVPGPFLGTAEASYTARTATLRPGDKLLIGTDGTRPDGDPNPGRDDRLLEAATRHRGLLGQAFVDAVARDLLAAVRHEEDFTLLCVEMTT
jgi:serine phosphatase RsbU (regulator of sigma subunit)